MSQDLAVLSMPYDSKEGMEGVRVRVRARVMIWVRGGGYLRGGSCVVPTRVVTFAFNLLSFLPCCSILLFACFFFWLPFYVKRLP